MEAVPNSTPLATGQEWHQQALHALVEAQTMAASMQSLLGRLIDDGDVSHMPHVHGTLEAVMACLARQESVVDPALDMAFPAGLYR